MLAGIPLPDAACPQERAIAGSSVIRRDDVADLFAASAAMVHRVAWRITGRPEDAEDVLQSVFLNVLKHPPSPWPGNPQAYVHRAAVNAALDVLRRRRRSPEADMGELPAAGAESDPASLLDERRLAEALRDALPSLSPLEAEVFSLRYLEERTNAEIAAMIGRTANHVGVTLHAARRKLRARIASCPDQPDRGPSPAAAVDGDEP